LGSLNKSFLITDQAFLDDDFRFSLIIVL